METICAWCGKVIQSDNIVEPRNCELKKSQIENKKSHGICENCAKKLQESVLKHDENNIINKSGVCTNN